MEHANTSYISLLIIVLLAAFVPLLLNNFKSIPIPLVVGEILAGIIVGKSGFNLIQDSVWLEFLSAFGFAFLMFLSGLEIDFDLLVNNKGITKKSEKYYNKPIFQASFIFIFTLILAGIFSKFMAMQGLVSNIPIMTLIMSTTSLGIVVPILKERKLLVEEFGQTILFASLIADFATMLLITVYVTFYMTGLIYKVLFLLLVFFSLFFVFYRMGIKYFNNPLVEELAHNTFQIEVRGSFALIVTFMVLAEQLGIEIILGAFLAGLIVALVRENDLSNLNMKLDAIGYGFFIPIFFITVGANFDITSVISNKTSLMLLPFMVLAVYLVKIVPALILKTKFSWKETISAGFLLSSRLSLIIAASAIGLKLNMISQATNDSIILIAIITCTLSPLFFEKFAPKVEIEESNSVFIVGINDRSMLLAQHLHQQHDTDLVLLTESEKYYNKASNIFPNVYHGSFSDTYWFKDLGIQAAKSVVIAVSSEEVAENLTRIFKKVLEIDNVVVISNSNKIGNVIKDYGAEFISPEFSTLFVAENYVLNPQTFKFLSGHDDDGYEFLEVKLSDPAYFNKTLRNIKLPGNALILSIIRDGEKIIPHGSTKLLEDDLIMIVGSNQCTQRTKELLEK